MTRARWPAWAVVALAGAAVVLGLVLVLRPAAPPGAAEQARAIAAELRCPDCAGLSAADSPTQAAAEIRRQIDEQLAAGQDAEQIKASFVARYGSWILLTPPGAVPWLVPLLATLAGAAILGWWLVGRRPGHVQPAAKPAVPAEGLGDEPRTEGTAAPNPAARRTAVGAAVALTALVGLGFALPEPFSLAAETVVNQPLAEAQAAEAARHAEIERLLAIVATDPTDAGTLSDLADAYLAGTTIEDLQRAGVTLLAVIGLDPEDPEPYGRLITAYIRASDWTDAEAATDALADLTPDSPDIHFFRGLIAWQGHQDAAAALEQFDAFLAAAPDDPRVPMIRALRQEAAAQTN